MKAVRVAIMKYLAVIAPLVFAGCATPQLPYPNLDEKFRVDIRAALNQPSTSVEMKLSALRAIQVPDRDSMVQRDAAAAYIALTGRPELYARESKVLQSTLDGLPLYRVPVEIQTLVYLGAKINNGVKSIEEIAGREVRQAVDTNCAPPAKGVYASLPADLASQAKKVFAVSMAAACHAAVAGSLEESFLRLVDAATMARARPGLGDELSEAGADASVATATRWFVARLRRQHGIDLNNVIPR